MRKPDFIGVGGQKCASTWISECLRYHPEIYMSEVKEIDFFDKAYGKGMDWYLAHFEGAGGGVKRVGEFSTHYLNDPDVPARIKKDLGDVSVIAAVRNPIDRFVSHYKHSMRTGRLDEAEFGKLTEENYQKAIERLPSLLRNGLYSEGLARYIDLFGREKVHIVLKDDIDANPAAAFRRVCRFLGVDERVQIDMVNKTVSAGIVPKVKFLEALRVKLFRFFKKINPKVITFVKKHGVSDLYRKANAQRDPMYVAPEVYRALETYYAPETDAMEKLLGRDLTAWRKPGAL